MKTLSELAEKGFLPELFIRTGIRQLNRRRLNGEKKEILKVKGFQSNDLLKI